jgi:uncharacterized cupredoxin-like copper-binding protein
MVLSCIDILHIGVGGHLDYRGVIMKKTRPIIYGLVLMAILIDIAILSVLIFPIQPSLGPSRLDLEPTREIVIYAAELPDGRFGYGFSPDNITSPGPPIKVKVDEVVRLTLIDIGKIPHSFAVVDKVSEPPNILFQSEIGTPSRPVYPNSSQSIVIQFKTPGTYNYMCTVPGHSQLGMWGVFIVEEG